ncbi:RNB-domain-containing protein [Auricularia subglabra TFB-10046 SS5]|nr:RNB-domain-containing protein [Auricularia subglabra TFB-10046 SS5]
MHRRAVLFARASRHARAQRCGRMLSSTARTDEQQAVGEKPGSIAPDDLQDLNKLTSRVIRATGEGSQRPGWTQSETAAEDALWRDTRRPASVPSEKKEQFMARSYEDSSSVPEPLAAESEDAYIEPGSFVELRRNNIATLAVMLNIRGSEMRRLCRSLTASGEIFEHDLTDAMWVMPDFIEPELVSQCGLDDAPQTPSQHAARVRIVSNLRRFERKLEDVQHRLALNKHKFYERVRNADPSQWAELKTTTAAQMLAGQQPDRTMVLATHRLLMADSFHYICHPNAHRVYQSFLVRPRNEVQNHERILKWSRDPSNPHIASFIEKAKQLLKHRHDKSSLSAPTPIPINSIPSFDQSDRAILLFLRQAAMGRRSIQQDCYSVYAMKLLKAVGFYKDKEPLTSSDIFNFLKAIGVLVPWEDDSWTRPQMFMLSKDAPGTTEQEKRHEVLVATRPSKDAAVNIRPRRDELYPRDIMEPLRRDFGQLPVYIIDDPTATELDDGVSVEHVPGEPDNYWMHIHIADPTAELHPEHELSAFARQMGTTLYYRHRTWLMLPHSFAMGRFSLGAPLREDWPKDRPMETFTFSAKLNRNGDILETQAAAGYIRNPVVLTYDAVDRILGPPYADIQYPFGAPVESAPIPPVPESAHGDLRLLEKLTGALRAQRMKQPIFSWQLDRPDITIPDGRSLPFRPYIPIEPVFFRGYPQVQYGVQPPTQGRSDHLVAESMIMAARAASRAATTLAVPLLRRHAPAAVAAPEVLAHLLSVRNERGYVDPYDVLRMGVLMPGGSYTLRRAEHAILGVPAGEGYARATSPLRRYLDLLTHWQLKSGLLRAAGFAHPPLFSVAVLRELAAEQGTREAENGRAMAENQRFWVVDYIQRVLDASAAAKGTKPELVFDSVVISSPELDMRNRLYFVKAHVPALGVFVHIDGVDKDATAVALASSIQQPADPKSKMRFLIAIVLALSLAGVHASPVDGNKSSSKAVSTKPSSTTHKTTATQSPTKSVKSTSTTTAKSTTTKKPTSTSSSVKSTSTSTKKNTTSSGKPTSTKVPTSTKSASTTHKTTSTSTKSTAKPTSTTKKSTSTSVKSTSTKKASSTSTKAASTTAKSTSTTVKSTTVPKTTPKSTSMSTSTRKTSTAKPTPTPTDPDSDDDGDDDDDDNDDDDDDGDDGEDDGDDGEDEGDDGEDNGDDGEDDGDDGDDGGNDEDDSGDDDGADDGGDGGPDDGADDGADDTAEDGPSDDGSSDDPSDTAPADAGDDNDATEDN